MSMRRSHDMNRITGTHRVCKLADQLEQTLGRSPTITELAQRLGVDQEEVLEALAVAQSHQELSLDRPVGDDTEVCLGDGLIRALTRHVIGARWPVDTRRRGHRTR